MKYSWNCLNNNGCQSKLCLSRRAKEKLHRQAFLAIPCKRNNTVSENTISIIT